MLRTSKNAARNLYFPERLIKAMENICNFPLTVIEAPMGYGKSTALREYLHNTEAKPLWQRVFDDSPNAFWHGFCRRLGDIDADQADRLLQLGFPNDSISRQEAVHIIESIRFANNSIFTIDDYHLVSGTEVNCFIEFLARNEITNLHLVISARFTGLENMDELKLKGCLLHITKEVFEFSPQEIKMYYRLCGINLPDAAADKLHTLTEGWISALYLFMLNYNRQEGNLSQTDLHTLIEQGVYKTLPESNRELLVRMSIFNGFSLEQAGYIAQADIPAATLDRLVGKNAFVTFDNQEKTYYIHSILKSFLREKLAQWAQPEQLALFQRAALWHREKGEYLFSMRNAFLAGDFTALFQVIELDKGFSLNFNYRDSFIRYFESCPKEIKKNFPEAMLIFARRMFTFNEMELFKKACLEFMTNIQSSDHLDQGEKNRLLGEYELLLSFTGYNDIEKMSAYHRRASQLLQAPSTILDGRGSWTFGSPSVLYMFYRESGQLAREVETIRQAMPVYYQVTNDHGKGAEDVMAAERHYFCGDFENAEIAMYRALQVASEVPQTGIIICAVFLQIRLALLKGDFAAIQQLFKKLHSDIHEQKWYLFMHTLDICEGYIYACLGRDRSIQPWIKNGEFKNTRLLFPAMAFLNIVYGRTLLTGGEFLKLIGCSGQFMSIASVFPNLLGQIYSQIYLAAAYNQIGRQEEALSALRQALDMAMPDRLYMPFAENGDFIRPLLAEIQEQGLYGEEIARILQIQDKYQKSVDQINKEYFNTGKSSLTAREIEIARLVAAGFSNTEVGKKLYVSPNTIKTQLKGIFQKAGIKSRLYLQQYLEENC